jgi:hypothetical protein
MSKFQSYFNAEAAALLAMGVYEKFNLLQDLKKAANDNDEIKSIYHDTKELKAILQSNIDDHERNTEGYPTSFSVCPDTGEGLYTRDQLKAIVKPMNIDGLISNIDKYSAIISEKALEPREKETLLRIIGALAEALSDQGPKNLNREGSPIVGTDESGIIGFLKKHGYITYSKSTLHKHISRGLKAAGDFKKQL